MLVVPLVWLPAIVRCSLRRQGPVLSPRVIRTGVTASFMIVALALALVVPAVTVVSVTRVTIHKSGRGGAVSERRQGVGSRVGVGCREMRVWVCYVSAFRMSVSP